MYDQYNDISFKKIISHLNFDINTDSCGSFDRYFWSWKKRDFQDSTLSFASIPLLKAFNKINNSDKEYIETIIINNLLKIQKRNGSFDQSYPNENHPKTGLDFSSVFYGVLMGRDDSKIEKAYRKLIDFSLLNEETYGVICNHLAHHMYEYLLAYNYFKNMKYYEMAKNNLDRILDFTSNEGWHQEYSNADAGYQTRTLKYLTKSIELFNDIEKSKCIGLAINSATFLDKVILPDGTIYSAFGSRNTSLLYPSGIEYMAYYYPEKFSNLCKRVRKSINDKIAIFPLQLEFDNFIRLFDDFLEAQTWYENNKFLKETNYIESDFDLTEYGLKKIIYRNHSIFIHYKYGGAIVIYRNNKLFYKNAGYLLKKDSFWYGSKNILVPSEYGYEGEEFVIKTELYKSIHQELTTIKLIFLRFLNLTVLKFKFMSDLFRKILVRMMISGKKELFGNVSIRRIKFNDNKIIIQDRFRLTFKPDKIYKTNYLNLFHMASSRYKHPVDIGFSDYMEVEETIEEIILLEKTDVI